MSKMASNVLSRMTRRLFVGGVLASLFCKTAHPAPDYFCFSFEEAGGAGLPGFTPLRFTEDFENGLAGVLAQLADLFQVKVGFGYYDDDPKFPNAAGLSSLLTTTIAG